MYTQAVVEPFEPFHAGSFEPAVSLTEDLPQGVDADILLLGCGDVRNIIYTSFVEQGMPERNLDITACDIDEFVIARNILLFTILLDDDENVSLRQIWNMYYNFYLDDSEVQILETQAKKLVKLSHTLRDWQESPYGATLRFCDEATITLVHYAWAVYAEEACPTMRTNRYHEKAFRHTWDNARTRQHYEKQLEATKQNVSRSCAPLAMEMASELLFTTHQHWEKGLINTQPLPASSNDKPGIPNPIFGRPIMTSRVLNPPTNPLLSFHLGAAQANLTDSSPLNIDNKGASSSDSQERMFNSALMQFADWTDAFVEAAPRTVIRYTACEAFALCYTLRFHRASGNTSCEYYRGKHGFEVFNLAASEYGETGKAPNQFDVIDTSTLSQSVGILNFLVSAAPLLKDGPSSTLYTADLRTRREFNFERLLHDQSTCISILLGLVPTEYWTNATAVSLVDQLLTASSDEAATREDKEPNFRFRISWKQIKHIAGQQSLPTLHVAIPDLVNLVYSVYCSTFFGGSPPVWTSSVKDAELLHVKYTPISTHQPPTIGAFLSTIGDRSHANAEQLWHRCVMHLVEHNSTNRGVGNHMAVFMFEAPPLPLVLSQNLAAKQPRRVVAPPFKKWSLRLRALAITVVVPLERWMGLKALADARTGQSREPALEISGHLTTHNAGGQSQRVTTVYSDVQISFGTITTVGSRDHENFTVHVKEDKAGWNGTSPMIVSYYIPTDFVEVMFNEGTVGVTTIRVSTDQARLKQVMKIPECDYETPIWDEGHVFITRTRPGQLFQGVNEGSLRELQRTFSPTDGAPPSAIVFSASCTELGDITTITGRINITSAKGRKLLTDKAPVRVEQASPFTLDVVIGSKMEGITIPLTFPAPVAKDRSRTRIARKSAYIEVIAPPAKPDTDSKVLDTFFLPTTNHVPGQPPATLNIPHLNLDTLPVLSLTDKSRTRFLTTLASLMFSPRERLQREQGLAASGTTNNNTATDTAPQVGQPPSARLNLKDSLYTMFTLASGRQSASAQPTKLFALSLPDTGVHILLFVGAVRLDGAHGSVVLDAAVLPLTRELTATGDDGPLTAFLRGLRGVPCCTLAIDADELALWKRTLPALAERCRTWMHRAGGAAGECEYAAEGGTTVPLGLGDGEPVLCGCGCGALPEGFVVDVPGWEAAARYATRVAISPVFVSGMVEEVVDPVLARAVAKDMGGGGGGGGGGVRRCRNCGRPERAGSVVVKKCTGCFVVEYCSAECQKKDWKRHRVECEAAVARTQK
ncbi:uncharacterized protein B0H64DRAFT_327590 [Chaetomium fimeti]|uniref:MYND-type domain-containing protein n=1 Tax=Chaetomium fimeti TaxID=1854472 RepID=A0AAE0HAZ2_9PEZI|nr:hypothetical protein B0H64DRAFT_327590 [Chaetomium fimeti]